MINTKLSLHFRNIFTQNTNKENRQGTLRYVSIQVSKCSESQRGTSSTSSSAIAETARRTIYFDSQNCEVEFFSQPFGGLGET